ncbi:unnamed protein product [Echinostoma caproni]|uniref:PH domain-containing protein n=1 Tax=Echinostoma caproni TaxID=27848 RepID=A0A183A426_9TREM|nr:unnamed protein product [Echinostoma caproni]
MSAFTLHLSPRRFLFFSSSDILHDADLQERAWCPDAMIHTELREYMQVDLGQQRIIKLIITKGRVAQSKVRLLYHVIRILSPPLPTL